MAEDDSEERAIPASRGRRCARLKPVPPAPLGEQTGAPSSAGAPVEFERCRNKVRGQSVFCDACELETIGIQVPSERPAGRARGPILQIEQVQLFEEELAGGPKDKTGEEFYDTRRPRGRPRKGISEREAIIDAELAEVEYVTHSPEEFRAMQADGRWAAILASSPQPGTRAWQHYRARIAGRAKNVNTAAQAKL